MLALGGLRLLDLSRQLPGPFCSTLLADLGMDVLVVAAPDDPFGIGIPFLARNKRSMTLDLKHERGRDVFLRLAARADVVLEGFRPGVTARLGIDWETLRARNPRLVYCAITGYGQDGPYRDKVGHDVNYLGYAGVLECIGEAGRPPVIPGVQIADIGGGTLMAAVGILSALWAREETGQGHTFKQVAAFKVKSARVLLAYQDAAFERSKAYLAKVRPADLDRVIDEPQYDPMPTVGVRLVSIVSDNTQHAGQVTYLRGLFERKRWGRA